MVRVAPRLGQWPGVDVGHQGNAAVAGEGCWTEVQTPRMNGTRIPGASRSPGAPWTLGMQLPPSDSARVLMADEVAQRPVRDLGDDKAARAAQQAATGRLCGISRLWRSVVIQLVGGSQRPDAVAVTGQRNASLDRIIAFRMRAGINARVLLDSDLAAMLPHLGRAVWVPETVEEFQTVDCSVKESRALLLERWGSRRSPPTTGPVTQWLNTC